jgi:hypothetical protein
MKMEQGVLKVSTYNSDAGESPKRMNTTKLKFFWDVVLCSMVKGH